MKEKPTSYRLSAEAKRLIRLLSERWSISHPAVIEVAVREKAARDGVAGDERKVTQR